MSEKLLPCPFCGAKAHLLTGMVEFVDVEITCTACSATGGNENEGILGENRAAAIAAWNRRTPAPEGEVAYDDVVLRADRDGKLQVYSSKFNFILMTFGRSMPEVERRVFFNRLIAAPASPVSGGYEPKANEPDTDTGREG
jgi:Lar family restriction alleviation protein